MQEGPATITRRTVLAGAGGAVAVLAFGAAARGAGPRPAFTDAQLAAYLEISADDRVVITTPELEFGQGVYTVLPMIVADELGADWPRVEVRQSWADARFANPMKGIQATGRSMSVRGQYALMRRLGATARALLVAAAAARWGVPAAACDARDGAVLHGASGRRLRFGELVAEAAALPVPGDVPLRPDGELRLVGRDQPRKDVPGKVLGTAVFGTDVRLPGLLVASIRQSPVFGGRLVAARERAARRVRGVHAVVRLGDAVAVVADDFWHSELALEALAPRFRGGEQPRASSEALRERRMAALDGPGVVASSVGTIGEQPPPGGRRLELDYEVPFLAHATMEPMSCTAMFDDLGCRLWAPTQGPMRLRDDVAAALGIPPERVAVERTFAGGGFGRRWQTDFGVQAALVARAVPGRPVRLTWSRVEDLQHDFYRPAFNLRARVDLAADGTLAALDARLAGASISEWGRPGRLQGKADPLAVSTFSDTPYRLPACRVAWASTPSPVPVGVWRSVAQSHNGFFMEGVIDEAALAAGRDPLAFRLALLDGQPALQRVLRAAAERAGWGTPLPPGEGRGIAFVVDQGSAVAQVAHVRLEAGRVRVLEVACAIDCGRALQPENVRMQMEGGIVFALTALFYGEIHVSGGAVTERNFHDYRMLSLADTPRIVVEIVEGGGPLGGVGEPGVPPLAPAVVNAIAAAGGPRIRSLPLLRHGLVA